MSKNALSNIENIYVFFGTGPAFLGQKRWYKKIP
jgi:hypothetical protein